MGAGGGPICCFSLDCRFSPPYGFPPSPGLFPVGFEALHNGAGLLAHRARQVGINRVMARHDPLQGCRIRRVSLDNAQACWDSSRRRLALRKKVNSTSPCSRINFVATLAICPWTQITRTRFKMDFIGLWPNPGIGDLPLAASSRRICRRELLGWQCATCFDPAPLRANAWCLAVCARYRLDQLPA